MTSEETPLTQTRSLGSVSEPEKIPTFEEGQLIDNKFVVRRKIDEGGFGGIYEVSLSNNPDKKLAMKLALTKDVGTDQLVKMEIGLLRRLSKLSSSFPHFHYSGTTEGFRYLVMDLLGPSLAEVQLNMPDEKFTTKTTVRIGLQLIDAIEVIHSCFFIHRDIKPGNMAIGQTNLRQIYLFDFGLARRFVQKTQVAGKVEFRPERVKAPFRGTYHYCSLQQHQFKDACRRDDLWSFMYTLIEFITSCLPWEHENDKKTIEKMKQETPISVLLQDCPPSFEDLLKHFDQLEFKSQPSYDLFRKTFNSILGEYDHDDPFDWELLRKSTEVSHHSSISTVTSSYTSTVYETSVESSGDVSSSSASSESEDLSDTSTEDPTLLTNLSDFSFDDSCSLMSETIN